MAKGTGKISREWIKQTKSYFKRFLQETGFPEPKRDGIRGPTFDYPEWLIMFIAILSVKCKLKHYVTIHRMVTEYWDAIGEGVNLKVLSERQLRDRLKKIGHSVGKPAAFIFQAFPEMDPANRRQCGQNDDQGERAGLA